MAYKKPDEMTWDEHVAELYNQMTERPGFTYDPNKDPLWQSAKDQYIQGGKRAMEDTIGQAASLTGGYASSYAQSAGQQQYNDYMTKLNGQLSQYASMARQNYDADTAALKDQLAYAQGMAERDYNRGRDALADERYQQEWEAEQAYKAWQQQQQEQSAANDQAYREWQMRQSEADASSDRDYRAWQMKQSEQNNAYSWAMQMLQSGQMPSDATLAAAGIDPTEAKQYANYYAGMIALSNSGGSGSGTGRSSGGSLYSYSPSSTPSPTQTNPQTDLTPKAQQNVFNDEYKGVRQTLYTLSQSGSQSDYNRAIQIMNSMEGRLTPKQESELVEWFKYLFGTGQQQTQKPSTTVTKPKSGGGGGGGTSYNAIM